MRSGTSSLIDGAGLPELLLRPLDDKSARNVLGHRFPGLPERFCGRVIHEAQGNPLALLELASTSEVEQAHWAEGELASVTLSRRLQDLFSSRILNLSPDARALLLLAALDGSGDVRLLVRALGAANLKALAEAEAAQLILVDQISTSLTFRQ
jgi:hypothetical protein